MMLFRWLLLLFPVICLAQTPEDAAKQAYLANINTLLIFTSEAGLSSGKYRFEHAGFEMKNYSLPFIHQFESGDPAFNWFIRGSAGYSITRLTTQVRPQTSDSDITLTHDNKLQTYTGGLGGGLRYQSPLGVDFLAGAGLIYSRVGTSIHPEDEIGEAIKALFDGEYNDNLTYTFYLSSQYEKQLAGFRVFSGIDLTLYETKSDFSFDVLSGFSTQSGVANARLGFESPALLRFQQHYLTVESYINANFLHGDIVDVVKFNRYANMGVTLYWNTPTTPDWAERFYVDVGTVVADGLTGYNIGLGFSFDF